MPVRKTFAARREPGNLSPERVQRHPVRPPFYEQAAFRVGYTQAQLPQLVARPTVAHTVGYLFINDSFKLKEVPSQTRKSPIPVPPIPDLAGKRGREPPRADSRLGRNRESGTPVSRFKFGRERESPGVPIGRKSGNRGYSSV